MNALCMRRRNGEPLLHHPPRPLHSSSDRSRVAARRLHSACASRLAPMAISISKTAILNRSGDRL